MLDQEFNPADIRIKLFRGPFTEELAFSAATIINGLVAACETAIDWIEYEDETGGLEQPHTASTVAQRIREAIEKATGEPWEREPTPSGPETETEQ